MTSRRFYPDIHALSKERFRARIHAASYLLMHEVNS